MSETETVIKEQLSELQEHLNKVGEEEVSVTTSLPAPPGAHVAGYVAGRGGFAYGDCGRGGRGGGGGRLDRVGNGFGDGAGVVACA